MFFFFDAPPTTEIYTLSLHDALPISIGVYSKRHKSWADIPDGGKVSIPNDPTNGGDRKSTRLNSSHGYISYAVFCLKKKNKTQATPTHKRVYPPAPTLKMILP